MPLAFFGTNMACERTGLNGAPEKLPIRSRSSRRERSCGRTDVRTIEIEPDTFSEVRNVLFSDAGVGA